LKLFSKISQIGWDAIPGEKDLDKLLRAIVISTLGHNGHRETIEEAKRRFALFFEDNNSLSLDLAGVVFRIVIGEGGEEEYEKLLKIYLEAKVPELRIKALGSLSSPHDPELIKRALEFGLTDKVRTQDIQSVYMGTSSTSVGRKLTWEFIKTRWEELKTKLGSGGLLLPRVIGYSSKEFSTEEDMNDFKNFFESRKEPGIERTIAQTLESIRSNISFKTREVENNKVWLQSNIK